MQLLTSTQQNLLKDERRVLGHLQAALVRLEAAREDQQALENAILQLDDFFLLVVAGEFNAGKSALINALIGTQVLEEGVTPTTSQVTVLRHSEREQRRVINAWQLEIESPTVLLRELSIVDTPGMNAIVREHEEITRRFLPRADLVLFVTSADRPFTESERGFLQAIRDWGKKIVLVINKIDLIDDEVDRTKIIEFVRQNAQQLLGIQPVIFTVSARLARRGRQGDTDALTASGFVDLEGFITDTLDSAERLRLKFSNPLGVAENLLERYGKMVHTQKNTLRDDLIALEHIESQLSFYREDMQRGFMRHMADIENSLYQMALRGNEYFAETVRLRRVFDLLDRQRIQLEFEQKVVANTPQEINEKVQTLIDWLLGSDLKQWQAVHEYLDERRRAYTDKLIGAAGQFQYDRQRLLDSLGQRALRIVDGYDKSREAQKLAESVQSAVAATAAMEISAVGLGALVSAVATTAAVDISGLLLAGTVAALGLFVIPARRRKAEKQLHERLETLRTDLTTALHSAFDREIEAGLQRIEESIAPYARFVRSQRTRLDELDTEFQELRETIGRLKAQIVSEI